MSVERAVISRINDLIKQGMPISPAGKKGSALTFEETQAIPGWMASANHAVELTCGGTLNAYGAMCRKIDTRYSAASFEGLYEVSAKSECVGAMISVLENLLSDVEAGLIASIEDRVRAETFDDFLDHAEKYHKEGRKVSGILAGVVFEDTIRNIAKRHGADTGRLDTTIDGLVKKNVITGTEAKRAKAAAHVRNKATHADWDEFELTDVGATIKFTRELIATHLEQE